MADRTGTITAALAGTIDIGGDLPVNRFGFGAMRITGEGIWSEPADREECKRVLRRAVALGINFIDTADSYGPEVSERLIAETLHPYPEDLVIATKGGLNRPGPGVWEPDGRPEHLRAACEGSLKRLRVEQIDVYQLHRPDPKVPLEESLGALVELKAEGKIRHIGLSNVTTDQVARSRWDLPRPTSLSSTRLPPNPAADASDSDPIAVSEPIHRHAAPTLPSPARGGG